MAPEPKRRPVGRPPGKTAEATKVRLVLAAEHEFATRGYERATISAIAARAGVTDGTLLHHVGTKAELYRLTVQSAASDIVDALTAAATTPGSLRERLVTIAEAAKVLHVRPSRSVLFAALPTELRWNPELAPAIEAVRRPLQLAFAGMATDALASGELPRHLTPAAVASMVESLVAGLGAASAAHTDPVDFVAVMDAYIAVLAGGPGGG